MAALSSIHRHGTPKGALKMFSTWPAVDGVEIIIKPEIPYTVASDESDKCCIYCVVCLRVEGFFYDDIANC
jgi:hypothetical protein